MAPLLFVAPFLILTVSGIFTFWAGWAAANTEAKSLRVRLAVAEALIEEASQKYLDAQFKLVLMGEKWRHTGNDLERMTERAQTYRDEREAERDRAEAEGKHRADLAAKLKSALEGGK